ncbi:hypothetical protein [Actinophytocola sp.]|uniref:hypothetical protein n=1 Tax=Actinophytocola sp. TaxID=1872138 RepID=UPI002ED91713
MFEAWRGYFLAHGLVFERGEVAVDGVRGFGDLGCDGVEFADSVGVVGCVELVGFGECFGNEVGLVGVEVVQGGEYGVVDLVGEQAWRGAFLAAVARTSETGVVAVRL